MWNRIRYTFWAPWYDALVAAADFGRARQRSIEGLGLQPGEHVLLVGAGTGLDLAQFRMVCPSPGWTSRLPCWSDAGDEPSALACQSTHASWMRDDSFQDEALRRHRLPPRACGDARTGTRAPRSRARAEARWASGGLRQGFLGDDEQAPLLRRLANLVIKPLFSDLNRRLGPLVRSTTLEITRDEPSAFGGLFRCRHPQKAAQARTDADRRRYSLGFFRGSSAGLT